MKITKKKEKKDEIDRLLEELEKKEPKHPEPENNKEELTYEQKCNFAGLIVDGYSVIDAAKKTGISDGYSALPKVQDLINYFERVSLTASSKSMLMKREEAIAKISDIARKSKEPVLVLRATKQLLDAAKGTEVKIKELAEALRDAAVIELPAIEKD